MSFLCCWLLFGSPFIRSGVKYPQIVNLFSNLVCHRLGQSVSKGARIPGAVTLLTDISHVIYNRKFYQVYVFDRVSLSLLTKSLISGQN